MPAHKHKEDTPSQEGIVLGYTQRMLAWSAYQESIKAVDQQVLTQSQANINGLRNTLWLKAGIYLVQFAIIAVAFFWSLSWAFHSQPGELWAWVVALVSLGLFGVLLFRNPLPAINHVLVDLTRIQILLQGYHRQLSQLDAVFKQNLLEDKMDMEHLEQSLDHLQKVIDGNIESLLQFLEEMGL